jgi:hypothetical protein
MANRNRSNKLVVPGVADALNQMKLEIAAELGIQDYDNIDKGALPSRINGMVGGSMTKRLIELGQQALANQGQANLNQTNLNYQEYQQEAMQDLQNATQQDLH